MVTGRLQQRTWAEDDGRRRESWEIVVEEVGGSLRFGGKRAERDAGAEHDQRRVAGAEQATAAAAIPTAAVAATESDAPSATRGPGRSRSRTSAAARSTGAQRS